MNTKDLVIYQKTKNIENMNAIINDKYPLSELTGKITGCAMEVHKIMGNGFQEVVYQRCLAIEMTAQGISFSREPKIRKDFHNSVVLCVFSV